MYGKEMNFGNNFNFVFFNFWLLFYDNSKHRKCSIIDRFFFRVLKYLFGHLSIVSSTYYYGCENEVIIKRQQ